MNKPILGQIHNRSSRPRVLFFIVGYPTFSETYMHEEIRSLWPDYEIKIITYRETEFPRANSFPYEVIKYKDSDLVYGPIEKARPEFAGWRQRLFLYKVSKIIRKFKPDFMHAHYLGLGLLLRKLAEDFKIPFTIRTHSMDVLSEPRNKLEAMTEAANSQWCLRVLAFPESRNRLIERGLHPDKVVSCWPVINFGKFYNPQKRTPTRRVMCAGPAIPKKAQHELVDLAVLMRGSGYEFDLYGKGSTEKSTRSYNEKAGNPINILYRDPDDMPGAYAEHDWLVYPSCTKINKVGLPVAIPEAQAAGLGVCWQELPGRRQEQLDFLGGGGFLFNSIADVPSIISQPYPEAMRQAGFEAARRCDIEQHKQLLTSAWNTRLAEQTSRLEHV
jgi:Glycosyltransferase Family 4